MIKTISLYLYKIVVEKKELYGKNIILGILYLFSLLFNVVVKLRFFCYRIGLLKRHSLDIPLVSIGNISVGGSGKTAFVQTLSDFLRDNFKIYSVILLRGYGGVIKGKRIKEKVKSKDQGQGKSEVNDNERVLSDREGVEGEKNKVKIKNKEKAVGGMVDEEAMLRQNLNDTPVLVGKDRIVNAEFASKELNADCVILDDGYQYFKLQRDLDIVLLKSSRILKEKYILPRGLLREQYLHLKRADILVITDADRVKKKELNYIEKKLNCYIKSNTVIIKAVYQPVSLFDIANNREVDFGVLKDKKILAVSGIGDPESFRYSLNKLNLNICKYMVYPDHYLYQQKDIDDVLSKVKEFRADNILTTQKDINKIYSYIKDFVKLNMGFFALKVKLNLIDNSKDKLYDKLHYIFNNKNT